MKLSVKQIKKSYLEIEKYHRKYLAEKGVSLPALEKNDKFTKDALVLIYLFQGYPNTRPVTKTELTQFIREYYPEVNDVQQARHLGAQKGWYILSGSRDNIVLSLNSGEYQLYSLEKAYPKYKRHRDFAELDWEDLKKAYGNRCATCGSEEGKPHLHWPDTRTEIQQAHMNPQKPLEKGNIIPQCQKCNRGDRNRWIYDNKGRVVGISNAAVIENCSQEIKRAIY